MPRKPKPQPDDAAESKRFIDMARELGSDETEKGREAFERTFGKVMGRPQESTSQKPQARNRSRRTRDAEGSQ